MANSPVRVTTVPERRDLRLKRVVDALKPRADAFKVYETPHSPASGSASPLRGTGDTS